MSPQFRGEVLGEVRRGIVKESRIFSENIAAKWYIAHLSANNIPVKVTQLGGGVKRVTLANKVCPHCGGRGYKT